MAPFAFRTIQLRVDRVGCRPRGPGWCRACRRRIYWCTTAAGKPVPFDEAPEVIESDGTFETVSTEHVHWGTCPAAHRFRRRVA